MSNKACPVNSGKYHPKRRRLLIVCVLISVLLFPYCVIAQVLCSSGNNYDNSFQELIQGLLEEEVTPIANNKFQKSVIQFTLFSLNFVSSTFIHSYQLKATFHDKPMKFILRL